MDKRQPFPHSGGVMRRRNSPARRLRGLALLSLLTGLVIGLAGLAPVANAKPAPPTTNSCSGTGCGPCPQNVTWTPFALNTMVIGYSFTIRSAVPTFFVSDARQVSNGLSSPIMVTVTSQQSRTYQVTASVGYTADLLSQLKLNVSVSIQISRTTSIGVNVQATVQPFSSILAEYGMHGYNVTYDATRWITSKDDLRRNVCLNSGTTTGLTTVGPTNVEGWRITQI
jgi:hypothetical protein